MSESEQDQQPEFEGLTITQHAQRAAESIRAINHLTVGPARARSLAYPQDVWRVVSELYSLVGRLGQTFQQLDGALSAIAESGRVRGIEDEYGAEPLSALNCGGIAGDLERALRDATSYTSRLSYDVAEDWSA